MKKLFFVLFLFGMTNPFVGAQSMSNGQVQSLVRQFQADPRGPYKDIRWFCKDGTFAMPKEKCPQPGGVQRARYKDVVVQLGKSNHLFLGQILSTTDNADFWDEGRYHSRLKQYQLEQYLRSTDDGWILRKAQYYRGAIQSEDEEAWGIQFFEWLLQKDRPLEQQFFLVRQAIKDIPHRGEDNNTLAIRAISKAISDNYSPFLDLRIKIHGQPEASDLQKVKNFYANNKSKLNATLQDQFDALIKDMTDFYKPFAMESLNPYLRQLPKASTVRQLLTIFTNTFSDKDDPVVLAIAAAEQLELIREEIIAIKGAKARLALLDISNALEGLYFQQVNKWQPETLGDAMTKVCYAGMAAKGTGLIEDWEWDQLLPVLAVSDSESITLEELSFFLDRSRNVVEWGTGMVNGVYKDVIYQFGGFEPEVYSFYDDRVRASVLLPLGNTIDQIGSYVATASNMTNQVLNLKGQQSFRGLNPGVALGELVVVRDNQEELEVSKDKIYVFFHPPSDLKPVAGIFTVSEGNMVSHVQLLARNLGIPNAVLSLDNMNQLAKLDGQKVFYAVSNKGTVIMKKANQMNAEEEALFTKKGRNENRITVPIEKMDLSQQSVLDMRSVDAQSSGKICGPKAANLGELKKLFPENVVEGLVLPFGVFRKHMDLPMPGQSGSYWDFLNQAFQQAKAMEQNGQSAEAVEAYSLQQLETLREAIKKIDLLPSFVKDLEDQFRAVFGKPIGKVPVFLRSDTNMEDLKDFTGAGLNLTLFNVADPSKILQGIKDVWASPYTERSFKWRQRYLLNPENVFPSILIIPSVDVEYSGVVITKGITTGDNEDVTVAFSRGAGGAVDGQAAESYLLDNTGENLLLAPAREPSHRRLPSSGGTTTNFAPFAMPILNSYNLQSLRWVASRINYVMANETETKSEGPHDIELGFLDNKIWLFQIRPFVENKNATTANYLERITPKIDGNQIIKRTQKLN